MQEATQNSSGHHMARLNRLIQVSLISGLTLSMLFMIIGAVLYFIHGSAQATGSVLSGVAAGNPISFMLLGIIILMITPAMRVVVAAIGYLLEGDWVYALVSFGVIVVLTASLLIGAV
jgi:uncharacterized membrane protein